jgi:hypothetical protein
MTNDPIVVWPPGTLYTECSQFGEYYDCTYDYWMNYPGALVCCPAW